MSLATIYTGTTPPANPTPDTLWLSSRLADVQVPAAPAERIPVITPTLTAEGNVCQEPSVVYFAGRWHMYYTAGFSGQIAYATAASPLGPWTKSGVVLGAGTAGEAGNAFHSSILVDGTTIYLYYTVPSSNKIRLATASTTAPTVFTVVGDIMSLPTSAVQMGNSAIFKRGTGDYVLFFDCSYNSNQWQAGYALGTAPTGPFTLTDLPIATMSPFGPYPASQGGGLCVLAEGTGYVAFTHWGPKTNGSIPTEGYRYTTTDPMLHTWAQDPGGPLIRRIHPYEVDQVADLYVAVGPNGDAWCFWTAFDNNSPLGAILCAPLRPVLKRWNGVDWITISGAGDQNGQVGYNLTTVSTANRALTNRDDTAFDAVGGALTATLPRASAGAFCRVSNVAASGTNAVSVVVKSGNGAATGVADVILGGAISLAPGATATMRCYVSGRWSRV